jgi:hypothetical protein
MPTHPAPTARPLPLSASLRASLRARLRARLRALRDTLRADLEAESARAHGRLGLFEWGALIMSAVALTAMNFLGTGEVFMWLWGERVSPASDYWQLAHLTHWVSACLVGYVLLPTLYLKVNGRALGDYYLSPRGLLQHPWGYLALLLPATALVGVVSYWPDFQAIYPFYAHASRSWLDLIAWEVAYGLQFVALEFFFRAFMLESLRPALGYGAIPIMLIPYCMVHFQKTAAESLGSIVAGVLLGWMAMRGRSMWGGVLLHWAVAVEMDVLSLMQRGDWPPGR